MALACQGEIDIAETERRWSIDFASTFADELAALQGMAADGLVALDARSIRVLAPGMLLLRNICMCFDRYLRHGGTSQRFSRAI
jgi:oxygen-independent coproporphyrinogen-3 oxidase